MFPFHFLSETETERERERERQREREREMIADCVSRTWLIDGEGGINVSTAERGLHLSAARKSIATAERERESPGHSGIHHK